MLLNLTTYTNKNYSIVCLLSDTLGKHELEGVKAYKYTDLRSATHNFKEEYKIGKGGYGEVFKVVI